MKNRECNFKLKGGHKVTLEDVMNSIKELDCKLTARLDEHDKMFKAHGWMK